MEFLKKNRIGIVLLCLLCLPMVKNIFGVTKDFSDLENRVLTTNITWDNDMFKSGVLAQRVEDYVQDQFPLRDIFVNIKSDVTVLLGQKENNGVYLGKEGFLFGQQTSPSEIFRDNLLAITTLAQEQEKELQIFAVPLSGVIYEEKLPFGVDAQAQKEVMETFREAIGEQGNYLDLYSLFRKPKKEPIYFKTDHHWTPYGAYLAYEMLMEEVEINPLTLKNFEKITVDNFYGTYYSKFRGHFIQSEPFTYYKTKEENLSVEYIGGDDKEDTLFFEEYLEERDKYKMFLGGNDPIAIIKNEKAMEKKKILVLKDSYANAMTPYLANTFEEIHLVDLRYYNASLQEYIKTEQFDEVILLYGMDSYLEQRQLRNLGY